MNVENLTIWNDARVVPDGAKKKIAAGRIAGMTDVNPVWRMQKMTELFGVCGIGWKYVVTKQWTETYGTEVKCFCNIDLYVKDNASGQWSDPIPGTGGSSLMTMERNGAYVSDEGYKMALTDALSVSMKALGIAADVYFAKGADYGTKYEPRTEQNQTAPAAAPAAAPSAKAQAASATPTAKAQVAPAAAPAQANVAPATAPSATTTAQDPILAELLEKANVAKSMDELTAIAKSRPINFQNNQQLRDALNARAQQIAQGV